MKTEKNKPFDAFYFLWTNLLTLGIIFTLYKTLFPQLWQAELATPLSHIAISFVVAHFIFAFVEFFFHRYVLHADIFPVFKHFYTEHNRHHNHTDVCIKDKTYHNDYPIMRTEQLESSFFPWYSFALFALGFTPFILLVSYFSGAAVLIGTYCALFFSIALYEFFHLLFHKPLSWWKPLFASRAGSLWKRVYAFHLDHHLTPNCNESVSGFFGLPIADLLLGTYHYSPSLCEHKAPADTDINRSGGLIIRLLDRLLLKQY